MVHENRLAFTTFIQQYLLKAKQVDADVFCLVGNSAFACKINNKIK